MKIVNREPNVKNKYKLTGKKIRKLRVQNREKLEEFGFWRNDVMKAWCITVKVGDNCYISDNTFWIGILDEPDNKKNQLIDYQFFAYGTSIEQTVEKFYKKSEILNEFDLLIQEKFLDLINKLIEANILIS
jgi:hypothetical protein